MKQSDVNQALDDVSFLKEQLYGQAARVPLAQRGLLMEQIEIINAGIMAAYIAGKENLAVPVDEFTK